MTRRCSLMFLVFIGLCFSSRSPQSQEQTHDDHTGLIPVELLERHQSGEPSSWASELQPISDSCPKFIVKGHLFHSRILVSGEDGDQEFPAPFLRYSSLGPVCSSAECSIWVINAPGSTPKDFDVLAPWETESGFFISRPITRTNFRRAVPRSFDAFVGVNSRMKIDYCAVYSDLGVVEVSGKVLLATGDPLATDLQEIRKVFVFRVQPERINPIRVVKLPLDH